MAFEGLTEKISATFKKLRGKGRLKEADVKEAMREIRMALLEADVSYKVVKDFTKSVTERCIGADVLESLTPAQMIVKIVNEELCKLMGSDTKHININPNGPTVVMLVGLQGAGKTTNGSKLAGLMKKQGKRPLLAACDIYRPAAIKQLQVVGEQVHVPVFEKGTQDPVKTALEAIEYARYYQRDVLIIDTAGRLHIDLELMDELVRIRDAVKPQEILLVVDAMTGQDAVNVAQTFNDKLDIQGVILTKLDGDTRGGAALSVRAVTGKPIKFSGVGEKLSDIEPFHPDRMASRILGMGDVLTLIDKASEAFDEKDLDKLANRSRNAELTLEDFLEQMQSMKKMGGIREMLKLLPGMSGHADQLEQVDDNALKKPEAIIRSMTPKERRNPSILNASRRKRIAAGSGTTVQDVNQLINQFEQAKKMMKSFMGRKGKARMRIPFR